MTAPSQLNPRLSLKNILLSFYLPLYEEFDRSNLWYSSADRSLSQSERDERYLVFNGPRVEEKNRNEIDSAYAFILSSFSLFPGGRGDEPLRTTLQLVVKEDIDIYDRVSLPLIDEIYRLYQQELTLKDFSVSGSPIDTGELVAPVFAGCTPGESGEDQGYRVWDMEFAVYSCRRSAKFDYSMS